MTYDYTYPTCNHNTGVDPYCGQDHAVKRCDTSSGTCELQGGYTYECYGPIYVN
jgi:hypothetical protein